MQLSFRWRLRLQIHDTRFIILRFIILRVTFCIFLYNFFFLSRFSNQNIHIYFILSCRKRQKENSNRQLFQTSPEQSFIIYKESGVVYSKDVEVCNVLEIRERERNLPPFRSFPPARIRVMTRGRQRRQIWTESFIRLFLSRYEWCVDLEKRNNFVCVIWSQGAPTSNDVPAYYHASRN